MEDVNIRSQIYGSKKRLEVCDCIVIHVPKTGGSSLQKILKNTNLNCLFLHVLNDYSLTSLLLNNLMVTKKKIIVTWRDPKDYYWSFYNFFKKYKHINLPDNYDKFLLLYNNIQVSYITNNRYLDNPATENDYQQVLKLIYRPNTLFFLGDKFSESLYKVKEFLSVDIDVNSTIERFNWDKPRLITGNNELYVTSNNKFDHKIYDKIIEKFNYYSHKDTILLFDIKQIPWYFPGNQFIINYKSREQELTNINNKILNAWDLDTISINDFLSQWLSHYPQYKNIKLQF